MPEWRTYELSDFLMFAPDTYWRLVARYNEENWPLQLAGLAAAIYLVRIAARLPAWGLRVIAIVLALAWTHVAWAFHWQHFAQINWAARYLGWAFMAQACLLLVLAAKGSSLHSPARLLRWTGMAVAMAGSLYPLVA